MVLVLPPYFAEIINGCYMTHDVTMVINEGRGLQIFFEPFSKCSWCFTKILIITVHPTTPEPAYIIPFLVMWSLSLGTTRRHLVV